MNPSERSPKILNRSHVALPLIVFMICAALFSTPAMAEKRTVLAVMSYEETYPWCEEIRAGIDAALAECCDVTYFYMNTKEDLAGGAQKAAEAFALYQELKPDGVIAADDNAQSMFVVPYLKGKVETPVMFCGVNATADVYGYPAENVSGILERYHIRESIALAQQLVPTARSVGFILWDSPTSKAIIKQMEGEMETYLMKPSGIKEPKTMAEAIAMTAEIRDKSDILFMGVWQGIPNEQGRKLTDKEAIPLIAKAFGKPTIGNVAFQVESGLLCAVAQTGDEQGRTAARMLQQAMDGTPVADIPVTRNRLGKRVINVSVLKELGIKPKPEVLRGSELVKTE